jgi:antitoxin (DNA-binding transcriptional repressor) of toxin-antitoxin stability system
MARMISVRELRNSTADVVAAIRAGERLSLTVNRAPVADILPHVATRSPWVGSGQLRAIVEEGGADAALLDDLAEVRADLIEK